MKIIADENIPFIENACKTVSNDIELVSGRVVSRKMVADADVLLVRSVTKVDAELLDGSSVKFVGTATIGTDHIDIDYLRENNIGFSSAPGSNANSVAEYITAALLTVGEKKGITLKSKKIGIVGVGNVGSLVEQKAITLGMIPVLNDPPLERTTCDSDRYRGLDEIYDCDFVTMHTPLTKDGQDATYHLCDEEFFKSLKRGCVFCNSSRGGVHDTNAIKKAVDKGLTGGLVLDVWENEPDIDVELLEMSDIATPHIAGYSYDGKIKGMMMVYEAMCNHLGLEIRCSIDDFLPEPLMPIVQMQQVGNDQQKIYYAVKKVYDIVEDDHRCRGIVDTPNHEMAEYFDKLRKSYPIRREFQNTTVTHVHGELADTLGALGFQVKN